jgi:hypothetical protein
MENPNVDGYGPRGSILTHDWATPEVNKTPIYIESTSDQISNVETRDMHPAHITRRHQVTPGERHSLLLYQPDKIKNLSQSLQEETMVQLMKLPWLKMVLLTMVGSLCF